MAKGGGSTFRNYQDDSFQDPEQDVVPGRYYYITVETNPNAEDTVGLPRFQNHGMYDSARSVGLHYTAMVTGLESSFKNAYTVLGTKTFMGEARDIAEIRNNETWLTRVWLVCIDRNGETLH